MLNPIYFKFQAQAPNPIRLIGHLHLEENLAHHPLRHSPQPQNRSHRLRRPPICRTRHRLLQGHCRIHFQLL